MVNIFDENIEDLLEVDVIQTLKRKYGTNNEEHAYLLLKLKYWLFNYFEEKFEINYFYGKFVLKELGIVTDKFTYQSKECNVGRYLDNSLLCVLDNLEYQYFEKTNGAETLKEQQDKILQFVKKKWKNSRITKKQCGDDYLNVRKIVQAYWGLQYLKEHLDLENHLISFDVYNQTSKGDYVEQIVAAANPYVHKKEIKEVDVENYIYEHLRDLFEGLRPISRQTIIKDGRLDIWARESNGLQRDVVIEVKNEIDNGLLVQMKNYREWFKHEFNREPRLMVVSTKWTEELIRYLGDEGIELYEISFRSQDINKFRHIKLINH